MQSHTHGQVVAPSSYIPDSVRARAGRSYVDVLAYSWSSTTAYRYQSAGYSYLDIPGSTVRVRTRRTFIADKTTIELLRLVDASSWGGYMLSWKLWCGVLLALPRAGIASR